MGAAKRRGTFEQRKAEAIAAGRQKQEKADYQAPEPALMLTRVLKFGLAYISERQKVKVVASK